MQCLEIAMARRRAAPVVLNRTDLRAGLWGIRTGAANDISFRWWKESMSMQESNELHDGCFGIVGGACIWPTRVNVPRSLHKPTRKDHRNRGSPDIDELANDAQKTGPTVCEDWQMLLD